MSLYPDAANSHRPRTARADIAFRWIAHLRRVLGGQEKPVACPELEAIRNHDAAIAAQLAENWNGSAASGVSCS